VDPFRTEKDAVIGQLLQIGHSDLAAIGRQLVSRHIVGQDQDDIRRTVPLFRSDHARTG
jgi:hypothetical protein